MKRPTLKVIDFDSVVQNTKSSKSIILMSAFSNILLQSRSSEATNIGYRFSSRAVFGWILFELNSGCGDLGGRRQKFSASSQNIVDRYFYLNWNSKYFRRTKVHYLLWNYWNIPMIVIKKIYFLFMSYMYLLMVIP